MSSSDESDSNQSDIETTERIQIREDLSAMTFQEILKLKEELGAKLYKEAVLGVDSTQHRHKKTTKDATSYKRLNKNRPREVSAKHQVPFLGAELRTLSKKKKEEVAVRDPRFDEKCGTYDVTTFKDNYKFIGKVRQKEIVRMKKKLQDVTEPEERTEIKSNMQRLINKNEEERKWHIKQEVLKRERQEIQNAHNEGRQPHYVTKKERRTTELVKQFEHLKKTGKLNKHLEKRRKKNASKDRKKLGLD